MGTSFQLSPCRVNRVNGARAESRQHPLSTGSLAILRFEPQKGPNALYKCRYTNFAYQPAAPAREATTDVERRKFTARNCKFVRWISQRTRHHQTGHGAANHA